MAFSEFLTPVLTHLSFQATDDSFLHVSDVRAKIRRKECSPQPALNPQSSGHESAGRFEIDKWKHMSQLNHFTVNIYTDGVNKKMIPMIVDRRTQVPNIMQHLKGIDFSDSEVKQYSQHKHWKQLADALKPVNSPRILRKSMSVPVNSVRPQKVRRSISEQDKRSVPVSHSRVSLKMCQEGRKSEVDRIVSTPSDDSKADDEIGQAAGNCCVSVDFGSFSAAAMTCGKGIFCTCRTF